MKEFNEEPLTKHELVSNIIEFIDNVDEILSSKYWYYEGVKEVTSLNKTLCT